MILNDYKIVENQLADSKIVKLLKFDPTVQK